jgi:hypothetical protein
LESHSTHAARRSLQKPKQTPPGQLVSVVQGRLSRDPRKQVIEQVTGVPGSHRPVEALQVSNPLQNNPS